MRVFLTSILLLGLSGCQTVSNVWSDFFGSSNKNVPAALVQFNPSVEVKQRANANVGSAAGSIFTPAMTKEGIFAVSFDGKLARYEPGTLQEKWRIDTGKKKSPVALVLQIIWWWLARPKAKSWPTISMAKPYGKPASAVKF